MLNMKCKFCSAELEPGMTKCPGCGAEVEQTQKLSAGKIALLVILSVAAIAVVVALILGGLNNGAVAPETTDPTTDASVPATEEAVDATVPADGNPDDVTCKGTYTVSDAELAALMDNVVATVGDQKLTNETLQVYYWMQFYDFLENYSAYAAYLGLDVYAPLDTQISLDGTQTWQQYFLSTGLNQWHTYAALYQKAADAGFEMDAMYRDELDSIPSVMNESALSMGFANAQEMIQADFGPGATLESYIAFMECYYQAMLYYGQQAEQIVVTDEQVDAYFTEHSEEYAANGLTKDTKLVDVRHILLMPEGGTTDENGKTVYSEEEWEACRAAAQAVLDEYLAGELTEERFAELANQYSTDPGSNTNGGLYTDVYVGQMVEPFENWCFDESRVVGDTGLVQTSYGYHVMFFVGSDLAWFETAQADMIGEQADKLVTDALAELPMTVDYASIVLGFVDFSTEG